MEESEPPVRSNLHVVLRLVFAFVSVVGWNWGAEVTALGPLQNTVRSVACQEGVPPAFALAIIEHESKFNNAMRGSRGEIGASQILPATATALGFDPARLGRDFTYNARA